MAAYSIYLAIITIQWIVTNGIKANAGRKRKAFLVVACIELIVLAGIRGYTVGADTVIYLSALNHYASLPRESILFAELEWPYVFEPGYFMFTKICAFLGFNETVFLFLVAILIYIPVFAAIYRESEDPYLSILAYFAFGLFGYSLGIFRQMIAISIVICGIGFIKRREFIKYLLLTLLAMTFHTTAFIALALYVIYPFRWKNIAVLSALGMATVLVIGRPIIMLIVKIFPRYEGAVGSIHDIQGGSYTMLLLYSVLFILYCWLNLIKQPKQMNKIAFDALALTLVIQGLGYSMALFGRIIGYFSIYLLFAIPSLAHLFHARSRKAIKLLIICCLLVLTVMNLKGNVYVGDYVTFWG